jgi:alkaline phosphatase D
MIRIVLLASATVLALAACAEPAPREAAELDTPAPSRETLTDAGLYQAPQTPWEALEPFYAQLDYTPPVAPAGPPLPGADIALSSIAFGSCNTADRELPILQTIAAEDHDLFMYVGDNVYGDARAYDATLPELRGAYQALADRPEFQALRAALAG